MFVFNMKLDGNRTIKILMGILCVVILMITFWVCYQLISNSFFKTNDENIKKDIIYEITPQNYTNVLKNVHENLDKYIGQKVKLSGYIYRLYDFQNDQFVLARNMIISSDFQNVVVGFLCHSNLANNYEDNTWVEVTGTIKKGNYNGDIPIIEIEEMEKISIPTQEESVYPPDSSFIPTSTVI